jgi:hypothetical protein
MGRQTPCIERGSAWRRCRDKGSGGIGGRPAAKWSGARPRVNRGFYIRQRAARCSCARRLHKRLGIYSATARGRSLD